MTKDSSIPKNSWHWEFSRPQSQQEKILLVCLMPPVPPVSGGAQYVFRTLLPVAEEYEFHLLIVGYENMKEDIASSLSQYEKLFRSVSLVARDTVPDTREDLLAYYEERLKEGLPFLDISYYSRRVVEMARKVIESHSITLLELHSTHVAYLKHFFPDIPALLVSHNIESELFPFWKPAGSPLSDAELERIASQSRKNAYDAEIKNKWKIDEMTFISREDMYRVSDSVNRHYLPLCFDAVPNRKKHAGINIIWVGSCDWGPNAEGISWFFKNIYPLIEKELCENAVHLTIIGKNPPDEIKALESKEGISVYGLVKNLDEVFEKADLLIAPILTGSGVRVKVLEAMSRGVAVIGTSCACKGVGLIHGRHVWIADAPEEFAKGIITLCQDANLRKGLAEAGTNFIRRYHNPEICHRLKRDIYNRLLHRKKGEKKALSASPYDGLGYLKPIPVIVLDREYHLSDAPPFSVIIPIKNEADTLAQYMVELSSQTVQPEEILIIDDGSEDGSVRILQEEAKRHNLPIRLLYSRDSPRAQKFGVASVAGNRNYGVANARTDLLVFTDAGNSLPRDFFANLTGPLAEDPELEMVGGIYQAQTPDITSKFVYDWDTLDWNIFLPAARALAVRKDVFHKAGGFPEFLSFAGEDALFDIQLRRICKRWAFNKKAIVCWHGPETREEAQKKYYTYGVGDGESGLGDFLFSNARQYLADHGALPPGFTANEPHYCAFQGYLAGRTRKGRIDRERRGVRKLAFFPVERPLWASPSSVGIINELTKKNVRVLCIIGNEEKNPNPGKYVGFDFTLCELFYMRDFSMSDYFSRYAYPPFGKDIMVVTDAENTGENVREFIARITSFSFTG